MSYISIAPYENCQFESYFALSDRNMFNIILRLQNVAVRTCIPETILNFMMKTVQVLNNYNPHLLSEQVVFADTIFTAV